MSLLLLFQPNLEASATPDTTFVPSTYQEIVYRRRAVFLPRRNTVPIIPPSADLVGVAATGDVAAFAPEVPTDVSLGAVATTAAVEAIGPEVVPAFGSASATVTAAAFTPSSLLTLGSVAATAGVEAIVASIEYQLVSASAIGAAAALAPDTEPAFESIAVDSSVGALGMAASFELSGAAADGAAAPLSVTLDVALGAVQSESGAGALTAQTGGIVNLGSAAADGGAGGFSPSATWALGSVAAIGTPQPFVVSSPLTPADSIAGVGEFLQTSDIAILSVEGKSAAVPFGILAEDVLESAEADGVAASFAESIPLVSISAVGVAATFSPQVRELSPDAGYVALMPPLPTAAVMNVFYSKVMPPMNYNAVVR